MRPPDSPSLPTPPNSSHDDFGQQGRIYRRSIAAMYFPVSIRLISRCLLYLFCKSLIRSRTLEVPCFYDRLAGPVLIASARFLAYIAAF